MRVVSQRVLLPARTDSVAGCTDEAVVVASCSSAGHMAQPAQGKAEERLDGSGCTCYCTGLVGRAGSGRQHTGSSAYWRTQRFELLVLVALQQLAAELVDAVCSCLRIVAALERQVLETDSSSTSGSLAVQKVQ